MKIIYFGLKSIIILLLALVALTLVTASTSVIGGVRSFVVQTGSMEPQIPVGSLIYVQPSLNYKIGEIITFKRGDLTVTHRIVGMNGSGNQTVFETRGDANPAVDAQTVKLSAVYGLNQLLVPEVGKLINFLKTVPGFLVLIVLPTMIFIGFETRTIKKEWEKQIEQKIMAKLKEVQENI